MGIENKVQEGKRIVETNRIGEAENLGDSIKRIAEKYLSRYFNFRGLLAHDASERKSGKGALRDASISFRLFLFFLKLTPVICLLGFGVSFFWDMEKIAGPVFVFNQSIAFDGLMRILTVSGLIGYATNYIAIKMLFRPIEKRPIFGQGLIPSQRDRIIDQLSKGIHEHILNEQLIRKRITDSGIISKINSAFVDGTHNLLEDQDFRIEVKEMVHRFLTEYFNRAEVQETLSGQIDTKLQENIGGGMKGFFFRAYKKIGKTDYEDLRISLVSGIPGMVNEIIEKVEAGTPQFTEWLQDKKLVMENFLTSLVFDVISKIDIRELLFRQMEHFDEQKLEKMVWSATNEQLIYIQLLGTILGILGGFLIWQPIAALIILGGGLLILLVLDVSIHHFRKL